jgi:DNA-directed RNA polymerase subunit M
MVKFCPECEKLLRRKKTADGQYILKCVACGYSEDYKKKKKKKKKRSKALEKKIKDTKTRIIDGSEKNLELKPKTNVECPECGHNEAYYEQFQTRSADEPATTFYECVKCKNRWREY